MKAKLVASAFSVVAVLSSAGCGVDEQLSSPMESTVESEAVVWCTDQAWRVNFYAEPAHINLVGWIQCNCFQPQQRSGTVSNYQALAYNHFCDLN